MPGRVHPSARIRLAASREAQVMMPYKRQAKEAVSSMSPFGSVRRAPGRFAHESIAHEMGYLRMSVYCADSGRARIEILNPIIYVQDHPELYALPTQLAYPQKFDRYLAHPNRIFCDIFRRVFSRRRLSHLDVPLIPSARFVPYHFSNVGI